MSPSQSCRRAPARVPALRLAIALLAVGLVLAGCGRNTGGSGGRNAVSVKGSDTMVILGQKWADLYMQSHPGVTVAVTGGGSGTGVAALINGTTDIAQSSRPMKDAEKAQIQEKTGAPVEEHAVARDGLTVYVHPTNPLNEITMDQLRRIYVGEITDWKDVGAPAGHITVYGRENSSGTYEFFKEHVLNKADFAPRTQTLPGTAAVVNAVSKDPSAIGYGGIAYGTGAKHVAIAATDSAGAPGAAVASSEETVRDGSYPLARDLYWYLTSKSPQRARDLLQWVLSDEGQAAVKDVGYFPIR